MQRRFGQRQLPDARRVPSPPGSPGPAERGRPMITFTSEFLESIRGGFVGLGVGDALGVPVETLSHEAILAATGGKGVDGYIEPKQTRVKDTGNLPPGSTSDDTQLALVTSRSLCRCRGFSLRDQGL